jgi:ribosomal protein L14
MSYLRRETSISDPTRTQKTHTGDPKKILVIIQKTQVARERVSWIRLTAFVLVSANGPSSGEQVFAKSLM